MLRRISGLQALMFILAVVIVAGSVVYAAFLSKKLENEERQRVEEWILANQVLQSSQEPGSIALSNVMMVNNEDIPMIAITEAGKIVDFRNLDSANVKTDPAYLQEKLAEFRGQHRPIEWVITDSPRLAYQVYYGNTKLRNQIRYYPIVQMVIVILFVGMLIGLLNARHKSTQSQLWAGMAKETAHQLGTPISSLQGWIAMLSQDERVPQEIVDELEKDVNRLNLVSDRFSKVGSRPSFQVKDIGSLVMEMVGYMKKRAPGRVNFETILPPENVEISCSPTLLSWALENLLKNALDSMDGKGRIKVELSQPENEVVIDVTDTGKGIKGGDWQQVFQPGYTTKKRGWGLGLTLSKRIVEEFHKGRLYVRYSEPGKGTTFRMVLPAGKIKENSFG